MKRLLLFAGIFAIFSSWAQLPESKTKFDGDGNPVSIEFYTYNTNNRLIETLTQVYDTSANEWVNSTRKVTDYNTTWSWLKDREELLDWDTLTSSWTGNQLTLNTYSATRLLEEQRIQKWNVDSAAYINFRQDLRYYDANNKLTPRMLLNWDEVNSVWVDFQTNTRSYDADGKLVEDVYYRDDIGRYNWKAEHEYDANGKKVKTKGFAWNTSTNDWRPHNEWHFEYNADGKETKRTEYRYNASAGVFLPYREIRKEYDEDAYLISEEEYFWNGSDWDKTSSSESNKDTDGDGLLDKNDLCPTTVVPTEPITEDNFQDYPYVETQVTICPGDVYMFDDEAISSFGLYFKYYVSTVGCDSVSALVVSESFSYADVQDFTICHGDSLLVGSFYAKEEGNYKDTLRSQQGCDSVILDYSLYFHELEAVVQDKGDHLYAVTEGVNYQWRNETTGELESDPKRTLVIKDKLDSYSLIVEDGWCSDTSDAYTYSALGLLSNRKLLEGVHIYPNPFEEKVNIDFSETKGDVIVNVFNDEGELLLSSEVYGSASSLDVEKLEQGVYLIEIQSPEGVHQQKIIKQ